VNLHFPFITSFSLCLPYAFLGPFNLLLLCIFSIVHVFSPLFVALMLPTYF
jgi:hypothetical protein